MSARSRSLRTAMLAATVVAVLVSSLLGVAPASAAQPGRPDTRDLWDRISDRLPDQRRGRPATIEATALRAFELDHAGLGEALAGAPAEQAAAAGLEVALPAPAGGFERFAVRSSPVMEPALAARHPEITTYNGQGLTDPTATVRLSLTPLGFHASVRGAHGSWYVDPYYAGDRSVHVSYFGRDLVNNQGVLTEPVNELKRLAEQALPDLHDHAGGEADAERAAGTQLRTYRLALASDPSYAAYHGAANVTAAKVVLVNRVTHIYEDESSIRLVLIGNNDAINLDTAAQATDPGGPCGAAACYPGALLSDCTGSLLDRNRIVIGQIIGASNFDIGHIVLGASGGVARGGVGGDGKAFGCTGHPRPVGDAFAVDYVAHEMGHQFTASHTWSGSDGSCSAGQFASAAAVEPGSGSSIMAYAGICGDDDIQANSDPYWSQYSFEQVDTYVTSTQPAIDEVQNVALRDFDGSDSFQLTYGANTSGEITRGVSYNAAGLQAALLGILPAGATATVAGYGGAATIGDSGFQVTFGGTLAGVNALQLGLANPNGTSGFVGEIAKGGPVDNQGNQVTGTGNTPPSVTVPSSFTIPYRTPFALTGSATDANGDALTYLWEQTDAAPTQRSLRSNTKTNGPLFRQFGTALDSSAYVGTDYEAAGENHPTSNPTRVFPDMAQILANNTNADTGSCASGNVECFSEFLPTSGYAGPLRFRLTARDNRAGGGGVNSADTTVNLAPGTGPFRVTEPDTAVTWQASTTRQVTWDVAGTAAAPINTAQVDVVLSTDGGQTFPTVLAAATPNDGSADVTVPDVDTTTARLMVRAVGNVFFDVSNSDFTIERTADMELVSLSDSQDPAYAGESVTYTVQARNNGPSVAENARVTDVLPAGTTFGSSSIPCSEAPTGTLTCGFGTLAVGETRTFTVTAAIPRDLVHNNGAPVTGSDTATAASDRVDPVPDNNQKTEPTLIKAKADLQTLDYDIIGAPPELMVGESATVTLRQLVTNVGPSAPMDSKVTQDASATPNATVTPTSTSDVALALGFTEQRSLDEQFTVACTGPGAATFTFDAGIQPDRVDDIDPDPSNDTRQASFTIDCIVPVAVNIEPGSFTNPTNRKSNGDTPLAVLTTAAGEYGLPLAFDATTITPTSVRFGSDTLVTAGGGARERHRTGHVLDEVERSDELTRDGDLDMVLHFRTKDARLTGSETEACVRGTFLGAGGAAYRFHGCDLVTFVQ